MGKIIMMRGLPRSGKTTWVNDFIKRSGNAVVVSRDDLRPMLHRGKWSPKKEGVTMSAQKALVEHLLKEVQTVIIDDTNLGDYHETRWKGVAKEANANFQIQAMEFPGLKELIIRDKASAAPRGNNTIISMALSYGYVQFPDDSIVICDLDGTLCDVSKRRHFVTGDGSKTKDWYQFNSQCVNDEIRVEIDQMLKDFLKEGKTIFFVSGRSDQFRPETEKWLEEKGWYNSNEHGHLVEDILPGVSNSQIMNLPKPYFGLFMRDKDGADTVIKKEILDKNFKLNWIHKVIDDRPSVIRMWRANGLDVIDCGDGVEF